MAEHIQHILRIQGLTTGFASSEGTAHAVDSVDLSIGQGETLGLVGESGCGKTVLALSVLGLVPDPPGRVLAGSALFADGQGPHRNGGRDLLALSERELQAVRGNEIGMIFQEPMTALNPVFKVGEQIVEGARRHQGLSKQQGRERAVELLQRVGIPNPERVALSYPHELSGGMRQRVVIAMAIACSPRLIFADEPTTALDVTIQAQILDLLEELREQSGGGGLLITHDLGVVARLCRRAAVMYAGQIVERGTVRDLFKEPAHPYTQGLIGSLPRPGVATLTPIPGVVPSIFHMPRGCRFHPRCPKAFALCHQEAPPEFQLGDDQTTPRTARCWLHK